MEVNYDRALDVFEKIPPHRKSPYLHPFYVSTDASRDPLLKPVFWIYEEDTDVFYHGFHLAKIENTSYYDIQSPYGYGGAISSSDDPSFLDRAWLVYTSWCKEKQVLAEFIRFHPLLQNWQIYRGEVIFNRDTVFVDLSKPDLISCYIPRTRTAIRKAIKSGLTVERQSPQQFSQFFPDLYNSTMSKLGAESFYFFPNAYHQFMLHWNKAQLAVCKQNDGNIAAAALFLVEADFMEYHLAASTQAGKLLGAMLLLLHETFLLAQGLGCKFVHLGGGTNSEINNSLLFFKSGFSKLRASFYIGKQFFYPDVYNAMKQEWQLKNGSVPNKVLFYR